jgi:hypothetical protein
VVIAGLDPAIHLYKQLQDLMDHRVKSGDDNLIR